MAWCMQWQLSNQLKTDILLAMRLSLFRYAPLTGHPVQHFHKWVRLMDSESTHKLLCIPESERCPLKLWVCFWAISVKNKRCIPLYLTVGVKYNLGPVSISLLKLSQLKAKSWSQPSNSLQTGFLSCVQVSDLGEISFYCFVRYNVHYSRLRQSQVRFGADLRNLSSLLK